MLSIIHGTSGRATAVPVSAASLSIHSLVSFLPTIFFSGLHGPFNEDQAARNPVFMLQSHANTSTCVTFTVLAGTNQGQMITVNSGENVTVGRSSSLEISILDPRMSRHHFCLDGAGPDWEIRDLGSLNGTLVNGTSVIQSALQQGDVVMAGDTKFQVSFPHGDCSPAPSSKLSRPTVDKKASNRTTSNFDDVS